MTAVAEHELHAVHASPPQSNTCTIPAIPTPCQDQHSFVIRRCHGDEFTFPVAVCVYCHGAWPDGRLHHGGILGDPGFPALHSASPALGAFSGSSVVWQAQGVARPSRAKTPEGTPQRCANGTAASAGTATEWTATE